MKKLLFILLCFACLFILTGCTKGDAKKGYELARSQIVEMYYKNGVKKDKVVFEGCEYVMVKNGKEKMYYFRIKYSVHFGTYANDFQKEFSWIKGNNGVDEISYQTYAGVLDSVNSGEVKGSVGNLKD
ncbi:MAG: hypothetical protein J5666_07995 [Bacilli bacterium]|nr:hypothetical protein [Bacilli bacterium]